MAKPSSPNPTTNDPKSTSKPSSSSLPSPLSPLSDLPDNGCTRRWNYYRPTFWHACIPVIAMLVYLLVAEGGSLKPDVTDANIKARSSYRTQKPDPVPLHNLLFNWAEITCEQHIPLHVHLPAFPRLSSSSLTPVATPPPSGYLPPPLSWARSFANSVISDDYPTTELQKKEREGPPFYTLLKIKHVSGYDGDGMESRGLGIFGLLARGLISPSRIFRVVKWFLYPFQSQRHKEAKARQIRINSQPFVLSGGGRGLYLSEPSTDEIVLQIPPKCHITADAAINSIFAAGTSLLNGPDPKVAPSQTRVAPYLTTGAGMMHPQSSAKPTNNPKLKDVVGNIAYSLSPLDDAFLLAIWLARERWLGADSDWAPYIRSLPGVQNLSLEEWRTVLDRIEKKENKAQSGKKKKFGSSRKMPTAEELFLNENPPPPQSCGWMLDPGHIKTALELLSLKGDVPTESWEREINSVRDYVEVIATGIAENVGWIITGGKPVEDGKKPGDFASVRNWDEFQTKEGLTVTEMVMWGICTTGNRGVSGLAQHELKLPPTNELFRQFREYFVNMSLKKGFKQPPQPSRVRIVPIMDMINHDPNLGGFVELDEPDARKIPEGSRLFKRPSTPLISDETLDNVYLKSIIDDRSAPVTEKRSPGNYHGGVSDEIREIQDESKDATIDPYLSMTTIRRYANSSKHYANPKLNQVPGTFVVYRKNKDYTGEILANYHTDGFSSFDWFLHFGFVPESLMQDYVHPRVAMPILEKNVLHPLNDESLPDLDGDYQGKTRLIGKRFQMQEERSKKWRRERGLPESAIFTTHPPETVKDGITGEGLDTNY